MTVIFNKWDIEKIKISNFYVVSLIHDKNGLKIRMRENEGDFQEFELSFEYVYSYRNTDEGDLLNQKDIFPNGNLFISYKSEYIDWFNKASSKIHEHEEVAHYAIYTDEDCIDILTPDTPIFKILSE